MPADNRDESLDDQSFTPAPIQDAPRRDPGDVDLGAVLAGHRSTRQAVLIPEKASLLSEIQKLEYRISHAPDDENVDDLIDRFDELVADYKSAQRFWTFEARSPEWIDNRRTAFARTNGIKLNRDKLPTTEHDAVLVISDQMVGQVVEVEPLHHDGETLTTVTMEHLTELYEDNAALWNLLQLTMNQVNQRAPQDDPVLSRDFSQRSSTARSGQAS